MPRWVQEGFSEFAKRLPNECALELTEIQPVRRGKHYDRKRAVYEEGSRILANVPKQAEVRALDVSGQLLDTAELAKELQAGMAGGRDWALLIGGPDGLAERCLNRANARWSLSRLTFPHPLVRIIVAEQLYRAWSLLAHHPYHRG